MWAEITVFHAKFSFFCSTNITAYTLFLARKALLEFIFALHIAITGAELLL